MQAIILAGGFGTRLRAVLADTPKPMAMIEGRPFLAHLLTYLQSQGFTRIVLSVHHLREKIQDYFQNRYQGMHIDYVVEDEPLGTGGAMLHAFRNQQYHQPMFVLNGDTFVKLDYQAMYVQHKKSKAQLTMALRSIVDCERYGKVVVTDGVITQFCEKGEAGPGLINAGVYLMEPTLFSSFLLPAQFSFEKDFLIPYLHVVKPHTFIANDYFIDIGIPEDYERAKQDFANVT